MRTYRPDGDLDRTDPADTVLSRSNALTTVGMVALVFFAAFEALAVTTVMPLVARELDEAEQGQRRHGHRNNRRRVIPPRSGHQSVAATGALSSPRQHENSRRYAFEGVRP